MVTTRIIEKIRNILPERWRKHLGDLKRWGRYVFYRRFFKRKFLGLFPAFRYLLKPFKEEKRILGIWNFAATPPTIGVFLEFQMRLLCMSHLNGNCKIDFAFIYDAKKVIVGPKYDFWVNASNFHYHFGEMYPMLNIIPQLGSILLFDSHDEFEAFYLNNEKRYIVHPAFFDYVNGSDSRPNITFIKDFYLKEKFLPKFKFKSATINWARAFIKKYVGDNYMVAIGIRNNSTYTPKRNSILGEWEKFFRYCFDKKYKVTFVILGRESEVRGIKEKLKELPNVIYSADESPNIEQNLALIELSLMYMATVFGPASFPLLSNHIPLIITKAENPEPPYDYKWFKEGDNYPWNNPEIQKLIWEHDNADTMIKEFERIFSTLDRAAWQKRVDIENINESKLEWPYN